MEAPKILRVRVSDGLSGTIERDFDPDVWYPISDKLPALEVEVDGGSLTVAAHSKSIGTLRPLADVASGRSWHKWEFGSYISRERRIGRLELKLDVPSNSSLRCYIIPSKLLSIMDVWSMIEAVEREVGRPIAWDLKTKSEFRAWVHEVFSKYARAIDDLLSDVDAESCAAQALRRDPPLELDPAGALQPIPELALIPIWAMRRRGEIERAAELVERDLEAYGRRLSEHMPGTRRAAGEKSMADARALLARLRSVERGVRNHIVRDELGRPLVFGPATQRDHRLRRLLRAFAPPKSETISDVASGCSRHPPVTLNELFERWAAIWLVDKLRQFGFSGPAERVVGTSMLVSARWTLTRDDIRIILDYEAEPAQLKDFELAPPVNERRETLVEWAIKRQFRDNDRSLFSSASDCSPDFILRIEGPAGRALAVGDACLADPKYHNAKTPSCKVNKAVDYRKSIYWWSGGRVIGCHPIGSFVIYPGPTALWDSLNKERQREDVWLFCPEPRQPDALAAEIFARFLKRLLGEVSHQ